MSPHGLGLTFTCAHLQTLCVCKWVNPWRVSSGSPAEILYDLHALIALCQDVTGGTERNRQKPKHFDVSRVTSASRAVPRAPSASDIWERRGWLPVWAVCGFSITVCFSFSLLEIITACGEMLAYSYTEDHIQFTTQRAVCSTSITCPNGFYTLYLPILHSKCCQLSNIFIWCLLY